MGGNKSRGGLGEYNGCGWYEWNSGPGKEYSNTGREKTSSETQNDTRSRGEPEHQHSTNKLPAMLPRSYHSRSELEKQRLSASIALSRYS